MAEYWGPQFGHTIALRAVKVEVRRIIITVPHPFTELVSGRPTTVNPALRDASTLTDLSAMV